MLQDSTLSLHNRLNTSNGGEENTALFGASGSMKDSGYLVKENIQGQVTAKHVGRRSAHVKNYSGSNASH